MRRAPHPVPTALYNLRYNMVSGLYDMVEAGITYSMQLEETRLLKDYFRTSKGISMADWYSKLDKFTKSRVVVEGNINKTYGDFFADAEYPEG